jgi:hypothetical protein
VQHRSSSKIELLYEVPDRLVTKQCQTNGQPNHPIGRKTSATQRHRPGLTQGFVDPAWIDQAGETLELMRARSAA